MISKSKLGVLTLVAMMGIATPAFAQKTGTVRNPYGNATKMVPRAHVRSGLRAFGMVPGPVFGSDGPSATGGGSIGYNSHNEAHY